MNERASAERASWIGSEKESSSDDDNNNNKCRKGKLAALVLSAARVSQRTQSQGQSHGDARLWGHELELATLCQPTARLPFESQTHSAQLAPPALNWTRREDATRVQHPPASQPARWPVCPLESAPVRSQSGQPNGKPNPICLIRTSSDLLCPLSAPNPALVSIWPTVAGRAGPATSPIWQPLFDSRNLRHLAAGKLTKNNNNHLSPSPRSQSAINQTTARPAEPTQQTRPAAAAVRRRSCSPPAAPVWLEREAGPA